MKSFVRIGRNFKAKMALNNKEWHVKTYIHQSVMKIFLQPIQLEKSVFLQLNCCKNLYHQSWRENMKITVNIKVIK